MYADGKPLEQQGEIFHIINNSEYLKLSPEEQYRYDRLLDMYLCSQSAFEIKKAEGRAEGIVGRNIEIALKMKQKGYSINDIINLTGLTKEEIEKSYTL